MALYVISDFGAVSMMRFDTFTRAIYVRFGTTFDRSSLAVLSLVLVGLVALVLAVEGGAAAAGRAVSPAGGGRGALAADCAVGSGGAGARLRS